jgi:hypothetical protein
VSNEIPVCPECDSSRIFPRSGRHNGRKGWKCDICVEMYDEPAYRERYRPTGFDKGSLPYKLLHTDPSEVTGGD